MEIKRLTIESDDNFNLIWPDITKLTVPPSSAGQMVEQIECLQLFMKKKDVDLSDDDGDNNSNSKYWEFIDSNQVQSWNIALVSMTDFIHFKAKFYH